MACYRPTAHYSFLLLSVIVIVGGLTFLPGLALGPMVEYLPLPPVTLY